MTKEKRNADLFYWTTAIPNKIRPGQGEIRPHQHMPIDKLETIAVQAIRNTNANPSPAQ